MVGAHLNAPLEPEQKSGFTESPCGQERTGSLSWIRELMGMNSRPLMDGMDAPLGNDLGFSSSLWIREGSGSGCWDWGREGAGKEFQGFSSYGSIFLYFYFCTFHFYRISYGIIWDGRDPKAHPGSPPAIPGVPGFWDELGMAEPLRAPG